MRRITATLVIALVGLVGSAVPVAASVDRPSPGIEVNGAFQGTGTWTFDAETCGFVHQLFTGTYTLGRHGLPGGTYDLDVCVATPDGGPVDRYPINGTFVVTLGHHVTLRGTVSGAGLVNGTLIPGLDLTLTVTTSSGTHRPARGTIIATGTTDQNSPPTTVETGTFTSHLHFA
ncbi:MAG TPA: hypothetical protein VGO78_23410 [Acidimicrobiales bacterium]|nr:hypothetical protein [Acidimicrobiales bacterium]